MNVCMYVYLIKLYRYLSPTYFSIYLFKSPYRFYGIRQKFVKNINWFPSTSADLRPSSVLCILQKRCDLCMYKFVRVECL